MTVRERFHIQAFISIYMVVSGLVLALTGIVCYIKPPARIANWISWRFLGFTKGEWEAVHTVFAFLFVIAAIIHIYLNWNTLWGYIRTRVEAGLNRKLELSLALVLTLTFFILTRAGIFPFGTVTRLGENLSNSWGTHGRIPPIPRVETYSLRTLCRLLELDLEEAMKKLRSEGLTAVDSLTTVSDIARENDIPPIEIGRILEVEVVR